ncbi:MAG: FKBP-type peptidyl-prolyl cis-trans isomerase [Chitinophagales bacterium]
MNRLSKLIVLLLPIAFFACKKTAVDQAKIDREIIQKYIRDNSLVADSTASGLYYVIADSGVGANPSATSVVLVYYTGKLTTGVQFDANEPGRPLDFSLQGVIKGWQEGIPLIKKGGKIKLLIPSALGYGATATGSIPANSVLIFDIKLDNFR